MDEINWEKTGHLEAVFLYSKPKIEWENLLDGSDIEVLELKFQNQSLYVMAIGQDDSMEIKLTPPRLINQWISRDLSQSEVWKNCISKSVIFFWTLMNSQGDQDGFQIQFQDLPEDKTTVQVMVMASRFKFYVVENLKLNL